MFVDIFVPNTLEQEWGTYLISRAAIIVDYR